MFKQRIIRTNSISPQGSNFDINSQDSNAIQIAKIQAMAAKQNAEIAANLEMMRINSTQHLEEMRLHSENTRMKIENTRIFISGIGWLLTCAVICFCAVAIRDGLIGKVSDIGKFFNSLNLTVWFTRAILCIIAVSEGVNLWSKVRQFAIDTCKKLWSVFWRWWKTSK
eukprot:gene29035-38424_t